MSRYGESRLRARLMTARSKLRAPLFIAIFALTGLARAQTEYPRKPVQIVLPLQAGSGSDIAIRTLAERLTASMGQPFLVENLTGAGGILGATKVARSSPDGYVLGAFNNGVLSVLPHLTTKLAFNPLVDFDAISLVALIPSALVVTADFPAQSVTEFVSQLRAAPNRFHYASAGVGSVQHIAMEMFKSSAGFDMTHVPYKGGIQAMLAVVTGESQAAFIGVSVALPHIKSARVRALAVGGTERSALLAGVPTMQEAGVAGYYYEPWLALYAPKSTPREVLMRLNAEVARALAPLNVRNRLLDQGLEVKTGSPEELTTRTRVEFDAMAKIIKQAGIRGE